MTGGPLIGNLYIDVDDSTGFGYGKHAMTVTQAGTYTLTMLGALELRAELAAVQQTYPLTVTASW